MTLASPLAIEVVVPYTVLLYRSTDHCRNQTMGKGPMQLIGQNNEILLHFGGFTDNFIMNIEHWCDIGLTGKMLAMYLSFLMVVDMCNLSSAD